MITTGRPARGDAARRNLYTLETSEKPAERRVFAVWSVITAISRVMA